MTLPAFSAERGRLQQISIDSWYVAPALAPAINIACTQGAQQQTSRTLLLLLSIDGINRRTDGHPTVT